jgi:hypothetical protein
MTARLPSRHHVDDVAVANARFAIGGDTVEVFGPRAEQLAHRLATSEWRGGKELADRLGAHVADDEGEDELELDEHERRALLRAADELVAASDQPPEDLLALSAALALRLGS